MKIGQVDKQKLAPLLEELSKAIEDLLLTGLTTASDSTRQTLNVSFQEASRLGLLRLGSTLRVACEELTRYTKNQEDFSRQRFAFFLNRAWLISRGLAIALKEGNDSEFERLSWTPSSTPVGQMEVVCLGVSKKIVPNTFCAFDFRLRVLSTDSAHLPIGQKLIWSSIFPIKPEAGVPAEGYLHLPQKQKFKAIDFMKGTKILIKDAGVALEKSGTGRLSLLEKSTISKGDIFEDWAQYTATWDPLAALERLQSHPPGPLDLDIELQEEIVLHDWKIDLPIEDGNDFKHTYPIMYKNVIFRGVVPRGADGVELDDTLHRMLTVKVPPPMFALLHYERCRLTLQPLSIFGSKGPEYMNISDRNVDPAALLKVMKF
ncbi:MAG: hypothetical protein EKK48_02325 [Candidatus Melainabacteria bacterium]|nr:MAG: hypothetical protein EKK48_02325 [Candidatus Melainabacteria bacterium]